MGSRYGQDLAQAQFVELGQLNAFEHPFGFVGHQQARLADFAQVIGNVVVLRGHPRTRVDHKDDHIGLGHRLLRLFGHLFVDARAGIGLKTTRVNDNELLTPLLAVAVMAVTGQARKVCHDGVPALGEAVEQRGFAHIRAAHQGQYRFHLKQFRSIIQGGIRRHPRCV